ncbi:hypothetical protein [Noviherbaspirillum suwonense]|uniref:hypothetical protein n=1 Tax=Noviherbaspirillum suwonense TaxID=1224511 RepID=UPI003D2A000C
MATNGVNVSVSITGGHSEICKTETHSLNSVAGSSIAAGRDLSIIATGGGKDSNINVVGSPLSGNSKDIYPRRQPGQPGLFARPQGTAQQQEHERRG